MKPKLVLLGVAAVVMAGSVLAGVAFWPSGSARATGADPSVRTGPTREMVNQVLSESQPGAVVRTDSAGAVSITGVLNDQGIAVMKDAEAAEHAGPAFIRCDETSDLLACTSVTSADALTALRNGEVVYGRGVHADITDKMVQSGTPVLSAQELLCASRAAALSCEPASSSSPALAPGETALAAYAPMNVSFDKSGMVIRATGSPSIPVGRTQP